MSDCPACGRPQMNRVIYRGLPGRHCPTPGCNVLIGLASWVPVKRTITQDGTDDLLYFIHHGFYVFALFGWLRLALNAHLLTWWGGKLGSRKSDWRRQFAASGNLERKGTAPSSRVMTASACDEGPLHENDNLWMEKTSEVKQEPSVMMEPVLRAEDSIQAEIDGQSAHSDARWTSPRRRQERFEGQNVLLRGLPGQKKTARRRRDIQKAKFVCRTSGFFAPRHPAKPLARGSKYRIAETIADNRLSLSSHDGHRARHVLEGAQVRRVKCIVGMDTGSAIKLLRLIGDIRRYGSADELFDHFGLGKSFPQTNEAGDVLDPFVWARHAALIEMTRSLAENAGPLRIHYRQFKILYGDEAALLVAARRLIMLAWHRLTNRSEHAPRGFGQLERRRKEAGRAA